MSVVVAISERKYLRNSKILAAKTRKLKRTGNIKGGLHKVLTTTILQKGRLPKTMMKTDRPEREDDGMLEPLESELHEVLPLRLRARPAHSDCDIPQFLSVYPEVFSNP